MADELPTPEEIEVETTDIYRHDEEQAYITLMSQQVKSLNFPAEENYTVRLCKEIVAYHYPDEMALGSFELLASNKIRSDEETLGEIFNGDSYFTDKPPAEDPEFDWVPRKEQAQRHRLPAPAPSSGRSGPAHVLPHQMLSAVSPVRRAATPVSQHLWRLQVFSDKMLMQLSIWKKEWDEVNNCYEPIDLSYKPYGHEQTRKWKKLGYLDEKNVLRDEGELIAEGKITDPELVDDYNKRQATIKVLREEHCFRLDHSKEAAYEIKVKDDINEALEWLSFHKEKDFNEAARLKKARAAGEEIEIEEEDPEPDDPNVQVYVCEPPMLRGL